MTVVLIVAGGLAVYLVLILVAAACIDTDPPLAVPRAYRTPNPVPEPRSPWRSMSPSTCPPPAPN